MTTLDALDLFDDGPDAPRPGAAPPRKCRRHDWMLTRRFEMPIRYECLRCGKPKDPAVSRRSKNNRNRGLSIQREVAAALEMEHIPGNGPADARDPRFIAEIKSGPSWYSVRVEAELDNLPTTGDRLPIFVAASTPGPGKGRRRTYVQISLGDLVKMVGPHVQVAMWAPEWVTLKHITEGGTE